MELVAQSPIPVATHKEYMKGAHAIDSLTVANIIKLRNPRLYNRLHLNFHISKKFELNKRTGLLEHLEKLTMVRAWTTPLYYIVQIASNTYYIKK